MLSIYALAPENCSLRVKKLFRERLKIREIREIKDPRKFSAIDGFQMSIKRPTSGGQTRDQEAAVQRTFHLERSSFFYLSVLMVRTRCSTY